MDRSQGRAVRGRARARPPPQEQRNQEQAAPHRGPQPQLAAAPPPQQSVWTARGRGGEAAGHPPKQQPQMRAQQTGPPTVDEAAQGLQLMKIDPSTAAGDAPGTFRGSEATRGACRQRKFPETFIYKNEGTVKSGTKGTLVRLQANYFRLTKTSNMTLHQYRVDFIPDIEITQVKKGLLKPHKEKFGRGYIFDGTVLFTLQRFDELELVSERTFDNSTVRIKIRRITDISPGDPHYTLLLNNILRKCLGLMNLTLVGRNYFDHNESIPLNEFRLEIWPGYVSSIRSHEEDILMNVDLSFKLLRKDTAYDLLATCRERSRDWKDLFERSIIGEVVITPYNNKTYKIDDIDFNSNPNSTFPKRDGSQISYRDYYFQRYQRAIRNNDQPLLVSRPTAKDRRGGQVYNIMLIPELVNLTGISDTMRSDYRTMKAIGDTTRVSPSTRIVRLENGFLRRLTEKKESKAELSMWNMAFENRLVELPGRVLPPEDIMIRTCSVRPDPKTADFTKAVIHAKSPLLDCAKLQRWAVIFPSKIQKGEVENFCQTLARAGRSLGIDFPRPALEPIPDDRAASYVNAIEHCVNEGFQIVVTILLTPRADRYDAIKKKCYINRHIPNQVVIGRNISKNNMSVCTKIAIQMDCKMGGSPWAVNIPFKGFPMIVGYDVCHDARLKGRSFGAMVASLNAQYTRYMSSVTEHTNGEELSNHMAIELKKFVIRFKANRGSVPDKIIFYRDGVGEGNFHYCLESEVASITQALKIFYPDSDVPLIFIIVSKRINTRLFFNGGNPEPGTVADSVITLPTMYDFFLVSQSVNQGTVSPTSYNIIYDKLRLKPDVVQQLSYKLCHMYYNWSGTVRVPAPCQYAHKLAFLVGQHLHQAPDTDLGETLYFL